jgi:hypothetical protein
MSDFEQALKNAKQLARTPEGQRLAALLQQLGGCDLRQAMDRASAGDLSAAQAALSTLMKDPQARKILEQLGGNHGA